MQENIVKIKVVGVGGCGSNVVNRMIDDGIADVKYVSINTDVGAVKRSGAECALQIGVKRTKGFGAGGDPQVGADSALEDLDAIREAVANCDMLFLAAGMGGGTGTGAIAVVAEVAKKLGILTVAVVTKPFLFEGDQRMRRAEEGLRKLEQSVDTMVVIPNENLKRSQPNRISLCNAFAVADNVLIQTIKNILYIIHRTAYINCDFSDLAGVLRDSGYMHTAFGIATGENRIDRVIDQVKDSALLGTSVVDATGVLCCITAPSNLWLDELGKIDSEITATIHPEAKMIFGFDFDDSVGDAVRVFLIATHKKKEA